MSRLVSVAAWAVVVGLLSLSAIVADDKDPLEPAKPKSPAASAAKEPALRVGEAAIEKLLAEPTDLKLSEMPLSDVVDYLKHKHCIEIQLDKRAMDEASVARALEEASVTPDTPITKDIRGVTLRSALNLMLKDIALTWTIRDEVLLITTPEEAESEGNYVTKVYPVADLVVCRDKNNELWDDYDTLTEVIKETVAASTWRELGGGDGSLFGASLGTAKVLIVNHTRAVHEQIAKLLADIREVAKKSPDNKPPQRDKPSRKPTKEHGPPGVGGMGMY